MWGYYGTPIMENQMEKWKMTWKLGLYRGYIGDIVFYLGILWYPLYHYRVRLYPPLGYSILDKEYDLSRFSHQQNTTRVANLRLSLEGFTGDV